MKKSVLFFIPVLFIACTSELNPEQQGQQMLAEARQLYSDGNYSAAHDTVLSLRKRFPTALNARHEAILLMDSIELQLAEGDSLKTEFFRRKLEHDIVEMRK